MNTKQENWLPIDGADGYYVSDLGNVKSDYRSLKLNVNIGGNLYVAIRTKVYTIRKLVASAFLPKNTGTVLFHDSDKSNCALNNLYYNKAGTVKVIKVKAVRVSYDDFKNSLLITSNKEYDRARITLSLINDKFKLDDLDLAMLKHLSSLVTSYETTVLATIDTLASKIKSGSVDLKTLTMIEKLINDSKNSV